MNLQKQNIFSVSSVGVPIRNTADYSPFGVQLVGRTIQGDFYRRGFNGMEKDDEVKGGGNSYTTEFRQYDARVGRWLSLDPLMVKFPWQSPYCAMDNNPISLNDPLGLETDGNTKGDEPKQTIGTEKNPVEVKEVTICGNCGVKNAVDKIASGLEAPKEAAPKTGNKALQNVDLSFFEDGFTTTSPQKRPFDESTRTSSQKNAYAFSTTFAKTYTGTLIGLASTGVLLEAAPVFLILAPKIGPKVASEVTMEAGEVAANQVVKNSVTQTESVMGHIFKDATGHVNPSTLTSKNNYIKLFEDVANNSSNLNPNVLTNFQRANEGFQGFAKIYRNGKQVWTHTRNGKIFDAGVNLLPK